MPELSLAFLTLPDVGPKEAIVLCHEVGFKKLGIRLIPAVPGEPDYPLLKDKSLQKEVGSLLKDLPISISDVEVVRINANTAAEDYLTLFEVCAKLRVPFVTVVNDDPDLNRATENMAKLAEAALPFGVVLNIEPMPWTALRNIPDGLNIMEGVAFDNVNILLDVFHYSRCGMSIEDIANVPKEKLRFAQICDAPLSFDPDVMAIREEARNRRWMPGDGELPIQTMLEALPSDIILSVEVPNKKLLVSLTPRQRVQLAMDKALKVISS